MVLRGAEPPLPGKEVGTMRRRTLFKDAFSDSPLMLLLLHGGAGVQVGKGRL